jgi:uncharacterized protein
MKFQPETLPGANPITRQQPGCVWVGPRPYTHSVVVPWSGEVEPWPVSGVAGLDAAHFERIAALHPEVVIFGSGQRLEFTSPALLRSLIEAGIGVETMDTAAACRTYNVLLSEGRKVLAALIVQPAP